MEDAKAAHRSFCRNIPIVVSLQVSEEDEAVRGGRKRSRTLVTDVRERLSSFYGPRSQGSVAPMIRPDRERSRDEKDACIRVACKYEYWTPANAAHHDQNQGGGRGRGVSRTKSGEETWRVKYLFSEEHGRQEAFFCVLSKYAKENLKSAEHEGDARREQ